jgi:hypothetical protein
VGDRNFEFQERIRSINLEMALLKNKEIDGFTKAKLWFFFFGARFLHK